MRSLRLLAVSVVTLAFAAPAWCTHIWFGGGDTAVSEGYIHELRYPAFGHGQYLATWSQHFQTSEGWGGYFYGGFVPRDDGKGPTLLQVCSWQMGGKGAPAEGIAFVHAGPHMSWAKSTWEGSAGGIKGMLPPDEFRQGSWYRFITRTYSNKRGTDDHCFVAVWMEDLEQHKWSHVSTTRYPGHISNLHGLFGFHEAFAGSQNTSPLAQSEYRNIYALHDGTWRPYTQATIHPQGDERVGITAIADGAGVQFTNIYPKTTGCTQEMMNNPDYQPGNNRSIDLKQKPKPDFIEPCVVASPTAMSAGGRTLVRWGFTGTPQLGVKLELFKNAQCTGTPAEVFEENDPELREKVLESAAAGVRITLLDAYGNSSAPVICAVAAAPVSPAVTSTRTSPGVQYQYYEFSEPVTQLPDFSTAREVRGGVCSSINLTPRRTRTNYAFRYSGLYNVRTSGIHQFTLTCASAGELVIDGKPVISSDGYQSIAPHIGAVALEKGLHTIEVKQAQGPVQLQQADDFLQLSCLAPGKTEPVAVAESDLSHAATANETAPETCVAQVFPSGEVTLKASGSEAGRVAYYATNPAFDYFAEQGAKGADYFLGETNAGEPVKAWLWAGKYAVHARRIVKNANGVETTSDSKPLIVNVPQSDLGPWHLTPLEHHAYPPLASVKGNRVTLVGESMSLLTQSLEGDGEITAHLADITSSGALPDGTSIDGHVWQAGLIWRNDLTPSPGEPLGGNSHYAAVLGCVDKSVRFCDSTMKNGAGNQPSGDVGGNNRWMKIARQGQVLTCSVSPDGSKWKDVKTVTLPKLQSKAEVGFYIYALPSSIQSVHHAVFDQVEIKRGTQK